MLFNLITAVAAPAVAAVLPQVLQLAVDTLRPNIVEVTLDLIHKLIAFRCAQAVLLWVLF